MPANCKHCMGIGNYTAYPLLNKHGEKIDPIYGDFDCPECSGTGRSQIPDAEVLKRGNEQCK